MSKLEELARQGQSIWLDYIRRNMLESGRLSQLRDQGVRGLTSNPSIFESAISNSDDYDDDLRLLAAEGKEPVAIYEALAIEDIQQAADIMRGVYEATDNVDGYISLEVNPNLAYDTAATIEEARRLFAAVDRPNVYIKVPATPDGIPAIEQLVSDGINVNVTLLFAVEVYEQVAEAYIAGLEKLAANGGDLSKVASVASFFVSRVDTKVDALLDESGNTELRGKIGIANAKIAYQRFLSIFAGDRWEKLEKQGAHLQRPLWASTSTKDPAFPDTLYVDALIGPHTVNTVPPETLEAFLDHGTVSRTVDDDVAAAKRQLQELGAAGISLDRVTAELLEEGVEKFAAPFNSLLQTIAGQTQQVLDERGQFSSELGELREEVDEAVKTLRKERALERLYDHDFTLWSDEPAEISNRLGWLSIADYMEANIDALGEFARKLVDESYDHVVLLGMGGSSLAPELFARTFGQSSGYLELSVLDSTDPEAISACTRSLDPTTTAFIASSKSGNTVETISLLKYFYNWVANAVQDEEPGDHFIAITDEGSKLEKLGRELGFRAVFLNDPNIGGRYSALSYVGLVPAAVLGIDLERLLASAQKISSAEDAADAAWLGAVLAAAHEMGRDKLTFVLSPEIASFADWAEQLVAESTGKSGKGILPIVGEPLAPSDAYGDDRFFVYVRLENGTHCDEQVAALADSGHPIVTAHLHDRYDLGEQFVLWEIATAIAGHLINIQPFNQPNVESAKRRAREMVEAYIESGTLPDDAPVLKRGGITVYDSEVPGGTPAEMLASFVDQVHEGDYVAIQAYIPPNDANDAALLNLRTYLRERTGVAITTGYGPRFLHSTGQLHKGDAGNGHFVQLVTEPLHDLPIPDEPGSPEASMTFGVLKMAQARGDALALREEGRRVIRIHLHGEASLLLPELQQAT